MDHTAKPHERDWDALRIEIGAKVRALRAARRWTQAELAQRLSLSQARLSEIERGKGSFSAEHLLEIFKLFNVDASHFASSPANPIDQLQNALARLGAVHLVESESVLPSDRVLEVNAVVREVLVDARHPRLVTALAPVLVARPDEVQLDLVSGQLAALGLQHRLGWVVDNTLASLALLDAAQVSKERARAYRRAEVVLKSWLTRMLSRPRKTAARDVLDPTIRSEQTLARVERASSPISKRWGVLSVLAPKDFAKAIEAADEAA